MADFKIIDHTNEILKATNEALYNALDIIGAKAADYAAAKAPKDTGRLQNSLTHEVVMVEKAVYVGTNVEYAPFVEYGHHQEVGRYVPAIGKRLVREFVPAKPYLKPAITRHMDEYKHILESELKM